VCAFLGASGWAALADARPFENGELFVGRTIKHSAKDRTFTAGAHFQVAPVKAIVQSVVKKQVDAYTAQNPEAKVLVEYIQYVDTEQVRALANSGQVEEFKKMLRAELKSQGKTLSPEQDAAINAVDAKKLTMLADIVDIYSEAQDKPTTTFSIEPYVAVNLKPVELKAQLGIAGFRTEDKTSIELGNLGFDLRTGDSYGPSGAAFGWTLGGSLWLPTGTDDADTIALSNPLAGPRYLHDFLSFTGYAVLGVELAMFDLTLRGEYVNMEPRTDKNKDKSTLNDIKPMRYMDLGFGLLADLGPVGITFEMDGLFNFKNAKALGGSWLTTLGVRGYLGPVQLGAAVQVPLVDGDESYASFGGVNLGTPADFNLLLNAQFKF